MKRCPYSWPHRSRKAMLAYLGEHESYCPMNIWNGGFVLAWNVKIYNLDITGKTADCDYPVQSTSIPGVSQRTGATTYYVEIYLVPAAQLNGRSPVMALTKRTARTTRTARTKRTTTRCSSRPLR